MGTYDSIYMKCPEYAKSIKTESGCPGLGGEGDWRVTANGHRFLLGVIKMFWA